MDSTFQSQTSGRILIVYGEGGATKNASIDKQEMSYLKGGGGGVKQKYILINKNCFFMF